MKNIKPETQKEKKRKNNEKRRVKVNCPICNKSMSQASISRHIKNIHN